MVLENVCYQAANSYEMETIIDYLTISLSRTISTGAFGGSELSARCGPARYRSKLLNKTKRWHIALTSTSGSDALQVKQPCLAACSDRVVYSSWILEDWIRVVRRSGVSSASPEGNSCAQLKNNSSFRCYPRPCRMFRSGLLEYHSWHLRTSERWITILQEQRAECEEFETFCDMYVHGPFLSPCMSCSERKPLMSCRWHVTNTSPWQLGWLHSWTVSRRSAQVCILSEETLGSHLQDCVEQFEYAQHRRPWRDLCLSTGSAPRRRWLFWGLDAVGSLLSVDHPLSWSKDEVIRSPSKATTSLPMFCH